MGVIDDILAKEPEQRTVEFCTDRALREALSTAQFDLEVARKHLDQSGVADRDRVRELRTQVDELEERVDGLVAEVKERGLIRFTFAALEQDEYDDLKAQHRPTEQQKAAARRDKRNPPEWNPDTFAPVLVAAACVKIETPTGTADGLSLEDAQRIWTSRAYNESERGELFNAAVTATVSRIRFDLPKDG